MAKIRVYDIKFPTTVEQGKALFDMNMTPADNVKSQLVHLIFTPVGQRLRDPNFGTSLIQFLFNPSDQQTFGDIEFEIKDKVNRYVPNCSIKSVSSDTTDEGLGVMVTVTYGVTGTDGTETVYELRQTI
jgi:Phage baseplate assembly protein W